MNLLIGYKLPTWLHKTNALNLFLLDPHKFSEKIIIVVVSRQAENCALALSCIIALCLISCGKVCKQLMRVQVDQHIF
jgi:hypothetical protein